MRKKLIVKAKDKNYYMCVCNNNGNWICGKCLIGKVEFKKDSICNSCGAIVTFAEIFNPIKEIRYCTFCNDELVNGETIELHYKYGCKCLVNNNVLE